MCFPQLQSVLTFTFLFPGLLLSVSLDLDKNTFCLNSNAPWDSLKELVQRWCVRMWQFLVDLRWFYGEAEKLKHEPTDIFVFRKICDHFQSNVEWNKINSSDISKSYFLRRKIKASINNDGRGSLKLVKLPKSFSTLIVSLACLQQFADRDDSFWSICRHRLFVYHRSRRMTRTRPGKTYWRFRPSHDLFIEAIFRCSVVNNHIVLAVTPNRLRMNSERSRVRASVIECWLTQNIFTASGLFRFRRVETLNKELEWLICYSGEPSLIALSPKSSPLPPWCRRTPSFCIWRTINVSAPFKAGSESSWRCGGWRITIIRLV